MDLGLFRAKRDELERFYGLFCERPGRNLAWTVLCAAYSLDSGGTTSRGQRQAGSTAGRPVKYPDGSYRGISLIRNCPRQRPTVGSCAVTRPETLNRTLLKPEPQVPKSTPKSPKVDPQKEPRSTKGHPSVGGWNSCQLCSWFLKALALNRSATRHRRLP